MTSTRCSVFSRNPMNKLGLRPSTILKKAPPSDSRRLRKSAKVLGATLGTLIALGGLVGICLVAASEFKAKPSPSKESTDVSVLPAVKASPAISAISATPAVSTTPAARYDGVVISQPAAGQAQPQPQPQPHNETLAADQSTIDQTSAPALSPTPGSVPVLKDDQKASVSDHEFLESKPPSAEPKNPDKQLSGTERKNLERARREAERKRSRLEEKYQKHEISSEDYKKGEQEYKSAIERYRTAVNAGR